MADKTKTQAQLRKEIELNKKRNDDLQKQLNKLAQQGIDKEIDAVEASLSTLMEDQDFDLADLKKRFKRLLEKSYGKGYSVKVVKKSSAISFNWPDLLKMMGENNITSESKALSASELASLYSGQSNVKFSQKWNDKPKELKKVGAAAAAKYYIKK